MALSLTDLLKTKGIDNPTVLAAIAAVPRDQFVTTETLPQSNQDRALPIGYGQSISQPYVVARMTSLLLAAKPIQRVLEIGTGSGYQAAILAQCVEQVYSIERIKPLYQQATLRLEKLNYHNISLRHGDGHQGWQSQAPFDAIIITAATATIPSKLLDQLDHLGRLVLPLGDPAGSQQLYVIDKQADGCLSQTADEGVIFVPLIADTEP